MDDTTRTVPPPRRRSLTDKLRQGLTRLAMARPDMPGWRFADDRVTFPKHEGRGITSPSSELLLWVWEHLDEVLRELDARTWSPGEAAPAPRAEETLRLVAVRLGLRPEEASDQARLLEALDQLKAESTAYRAVVARLAQARFDHEPTLQGVEDRARRAALVLCDGLADYDEGYQGMLVAAAPHVREDMRGAATVLSRESGGAAFTAFGVQDDDDPTWAGVMAGRRADALVAAGPLLWILVRVLEDLRPGRGRP